MTRSDEKPFGIVRQKTRSGMPYLVLIRGGHEISRVYIRKTGEHVEDYELGFSNKSSPTKNEIKALLKNAKEYWADVVREASAKVEAPAYRVPLHEGAYGARESYIPCSSLRLDSQKHVSYTT